MTGFIQYKAKIKYAAPMSRSIYVAALGSEDCEVALDIAAESLHITVNTKGVYADSERAARIREVAKETSERIAAYLTLRGSIVTELRFNGSQFPRATGGRVATSNEFNVEVRAAPQSIDTDLLENALNNSADSESWLFAKQFWIAQDQDVSRFMLLYQLIRQIGGGSQIQLDELIKRAEPICPFSISGDKRKAAKGQEESIYTKLRNQINHAERAPGGYASTIDEIHRILPKFEDTTRKILDAHIDFDFRS